VAVHVNIDSVRDRFASSHIRFRSLESSGGLFLLLGGLSSTTSRVCRTDEGGAKQGEDAGFEVHGGGFEMRGG
jgi:hypothetical protein